MEEILSTIQQGVSTVFGQPAKWVREDGTQRKLKDMPSV